MCRANFIPLSSPHKFFHFSCRIARVMLNVISLTHDIILNSRNPSTCFEWLRTGWVRFHFVFYDLHITSFYLKHTWPNHRSLSVLRNLLLWLGGHKSVNFLHNGANEYVHGFHVQISDTNAIALQTNGSQTLSCTFDWLCGHVVAGKSRIWIQKITQGVAENDTIRHNSTNFKLWLR